MFLERYRMLLQRNEGLPVGIGAGNISETSRSILGEIAALWMSWRTCWISLQSAALCQTCKISSRVKSSTSFRCQLPIPLYCTLPLSTIGQLNPISRLYTQLFCFNSSCQYHSCLVWKNTLNGSSLYYNPFVSWHFSATLRMKVAATNSSVFVVLPQEAFHWSIVDS